MEPSALSTATAAGPGCCGGRPGDICWVARSCSDERLGAHPLGRLRVLASIAAGARLCLLPDMDCADSLESTLGVGSAIMLKSRLRSGRRPTQAWVGIEAGVPVGLDELRPAKAQSAARSAAPVRGIRPIEPGFVGVSRTSVTTTHPAPLRPRSMQVNSSLYP